MNKKQSKRQRDIKQKLMAAICMLLVSSIMMVSTTYAWFTLSTAPEVTGITTAVGANGNLEMALQPMNGDSSKIGTSVGDSVKAIIEKNVTWGNLVDVSSTDYYGLNNISLYPSQLNATNGVIGTNPLSTPSYGADGRISELENKTITGVYNSTEKKFLEDYSVTVNNVTNTIEKAKGVRAVGISSSMSDRQLAYRAALSAANSAAQQAQRTASESLNSKGAALADIAIKHATFSATDDVPKELYSVAELQSLQAILNTLLGDENNTGSLGYIEEALIQYALATALGNTTGVTDDNYDTVVTDFETVDITATTENLTTIMAKYSVTNASVTGYIDELQTTLKNVTDAKTGIDGLLNGAAEDKTFAWDDFNDYLTLLANPNMMEVNGIEVQNLKKNWEYKTGEVLPEGYYVAEGADSEDKPGDAGYVYDDEKKIVSNMSRLVNAVLSDGLNLIISSGAGVYADIADFTGDYSASVKLSKISYGGMSVKNLDATMSTNTSQDTPYLDQAANAVPKFNAGTGSASNAISDFYGYILDLAFRTNVAGSNLQLQADAVDRIYSEGTNNDETMGHGASMTFTSSVTTFTDTQVKNLMGCIRVVFFNTDDNAIIGYARLDTEKASNPSTGGIKMPLVMTDENGKKIADDPSTTADESKKIMALEQNTVHELSVLVYLDGEAITNADVANGVKSMTGSMNLQFSSSATLDPMDYTALKEGTSDTTTTTPTYTAEDVTTGTVSDGYAATIKYVSDGTNNKLVAVVTKDSQPVTSGVTVKIGDADASYQTLGTYSGWVVDGGTAKPTEAVNVTVTPTT